MKSAKIISGILCLVLFPCIIYAQNITISGYVTEKKTGERLTGATVFAPKTNAGTATNTYGFYSLTVPAGTDIEIRTSYVGFSPFVHTVAGNKDVQMDIALETPQDMKEVVIVAQKDALQTRTQMSSIDLPIETIKSLPAFLGEVDIMRAIQLLPGIQAGNEGSTGLYVRGGSPDQNLILLDGVPVYNASHLFGFFSVFNADAIRSVEVVKGGFPARYGGRLSSVIDINMKEGNNNKLQGEGGIGLIASRLTLEGPIQKGKSSFMVSGRRTYVDVLAAPFMRGDIKAGYYFYDLNGKANFSLGRKDHIYVSGYFGNDKFYANERSDNSGFSTTVFNSSLNWGNLTAVGRWNHEFNKKLFGNLTTYYSQYKFAISARERSTTAGSKDEFELKYNSGINDKAVKYDFDFIPGANHFVKMGAGFINHTYTPGIQRVKMTAGQVKQDTTIGDKEIQANEIDAYIEDDVRLTSKLKANIGVHVTGFSVRDDMFYTVQPRAALRYLINDQLSAKASYVEMSQFIHLLTNSSIGLPTDLWVPVTDKVPVQKSKQAAAGFAYTHKTGIEVSLEGYYKDMKNVIEYKEGSSYFNSTTSWEEKVALGTGRSYGGELFLQKKKGKFTGLMGYTLSWTNRKFAALNNGERFPYKYDRRHDFKIAGVYAVSKNIELSAEWVYGTGNAVTIPTAVIPGLDGNMIQLYGARNGYRAPAYHRGDISAKFSKQHKNWTSAWVVSVYNVYDRRNPFYIYSSTGKEGNTIFKQVSLFPILPSVSYQFKF